MTVSPYTLNNLYNQGVLDYVPYELCGSSNVAALNGMQNPYMQAAMQGNLYKQAENEADKFQKTSNMPFGTGSIGTESTAGGASAWGFGNNAAKSGMNNALGMGTIGAQSQAGLNAYGISGIGENSTAGGANAWGGFGDVSKNVSDKVSQTMSTVNAMPSVVKGIASAAMITVSLILLFKKGKKVPQTTNTGFFAKLNPVNWFKKNKI